VSCRVSCVPCVVCRVSCAYRKTSPKQPPPTFSKHFISWGWTSGGPEWRPAPAAPPPAAEADVDDAAPAAPRAELGAGAGSTRGLDGVVVRVGVTRPDVDEEEAGVGLVGVVGVGVVVEGAGADDESWSDPRSSGARRKSSLCSVLRASIPFKKIIIIMSSLDQFQ
jgi:hypothetical protein